MVKKVAPEPSMLHSKPCKMVTNGPSLETPRDLKMNLFAVYRIELQYSLQICHLLTYVY